MFLDDDDKIIREKLIEFLKKYKIDIDEDKFHLETDDEYIEINCSGKGFVGMNNAVRGISSDFSYDIDGYEWLYPSHKEKALLLPTNKDEEDMFMDIDNTKEIINSIKSKDYSTSFFVTKIRDREELKNKLLKLPTSRAA